jgi:acetoin utilization protein AcuB
MAAPAHMLSRIMTKRVVTVKMDDTLQRIRAVFLAQKFHHLIVVDDGRVVGVISDRDLLKNISPFIGQPMMERSQDVNTLSKRAHQIMSRAPVVAREDTPVIEAATLVLRERVSCLPVVDDRMRIRGIVTWRDLLRACCPCQGGEVRGQAA